MRRVAWALPLVAGLVLSCGGGAKPAGEAPQREQNIGDQTANVSSDTATLKEVQAAVNEVLRAGIDCELVRPAADQANVKIEQARPKMRTPAGLATLDQLKAQVRHVSQACS